MIANQIILIIMMFLSYSIGLVLNFDALRSTEQNIIFFHAIGHRMTDFENPIWQKIVGSIFYTFADVFLFIYRCFYQLTKVNNPNFDLVIFLMHPEGAWLSPGTFCILIGILIMQYSNKKISS